MDKCNYCFEDKIVYPQNNGLSCCKDCLFTLLDMQKSSPDGFILLQKAQRRITGLCLEKETVNLCIIILEEELKAYQTIFTPK